MTLTAPEAEGEYTLRYVAEDPARGRIVLAQETLVVRTPPPVTVAPTEIFRRCDGATGPSCEILLPAQDVVLALTAGNGMTEPLFSETSGGARADRPPFDLVHLSDGEVAALVNARQAEAIYCQDGLAGDVICLTHDFNDSDSMLAGFLFGTLAKVASPAEAEATCGEEAPLIPPGDLPGACLFSIDMPATP